MRLLLFILALGFVHSNVYGDSYFFRPVAEPSAKSIDNGNLHLVLPLEKTEAPKAQSIIALRQEFENEEKYLIQVNLAENVEKGWIPMLKLGDDILFQGVLVTRGAESPVSFSITSDDPDRIELWCRLLGELMKVPEERIHIDLK